MKTGISMASICLLPVLLANCGSADGVRHVASSSRHYVISGTSTTGELSINRVQILTESGHTSVTVSRDQKITPVARIKYSGRGQLLANWLYDGQIVEQVNINLGYGSDLTLNPASTTQMPVFIAGTHRISLQIKKPQINFALPELKVFVKSH